MSRATEITVECPGCGTSYETRHGALMHLGLEGLTGEYFEEKSTAECPNCGYRVYRGSLAVGADGVWRFSPEGNG